MKFFASVHFYSAPKLVLYANNNYEILQRIIKMYAVILLIVGK